MKSYGYLLKSKKEVQIGLGAGITVHVLSQICGSQYVTYQNEVTFYACIFFKSLQAYMRLKFNSVIKKLWIYFLYVVLITGKIKKYGYT